MQKGGGQKCAMPLTVMVQNYLPPSSSYILLAKASHLAMPMSVEQEVYLTSSGTVNPQGKGPGYRER